MGKIFIERSVGASATTENNIVKPETQLRKNIGTDL